MAAPEIQNRKAFHNYQIHSNLEAGIELLGTEVKSLRAGKGNLSDAFARIERGQAMLYNFDIATYSHGNRENHEPKRTRRLLLHKAEIRKLFNEVTISGKALVPLKGYFKEGIFKILLGTGTGKDKGDKRQTLKKRETERHLRRVMTRRR